MKHKKKCLPMSSIMVLSLALFSGLSQVAHAESSMDESRSAQVFLFEQLSQKSGLEDLDKASCVSWISASLADYSAVYDGSDGGSYTCSIKYETRSLRDSNETTLRTASVEYEAKPIQFADFRKMGLMGDALKKRYGIFNFPGDEPGVPGGKPSASEVVFGIPNMALHGLYSSLNVASDAVNAIIELFSTPIAEQKMNLMPNFRSIFAAQQASCHVAALELLDLACNDSRADIVNTTAVQLKSLQARQTLIEQIIPKKPQRH